MFSDRCDGSLKNFASMSRDKTGGWFSSVVGNISGLWSRSSLEPIAEQQNQSAGQQNVRSRSNVLDISLEEQDEIDVLDDDNMDDGIIIQECTSTAADNATTSRGGMYCIPGFFFGARASFFANVNIRSSLQL